MDDKGFNDTEPEIQFVLNPLSLEPEDEQEEEPEKAIKDPWHSRQLDVHRWSDHPEIVKVVDTIWQANFTQLDVAGRSGPKPKRSFRQQLRVLVLDLYVAWLEDPDLCIGVSMSQNDWETWSRYNALRISKKIIPLIHGLAKVGLIDLAKGSYSGPYAPYNHTTRIRAAEPLRELFRAAKMTRDDVIQAPEQECIILKAGDGEGTKFVDYKDTEATNWMRADLQAYNHVLAHAFIDIPSLGNPWIERLDERGKVSRVHVDHHHQNVRRIFSRGSWEANGRFYGPWWQQIGSDLRKDIYINDTPTVEVDFKGLHVAILGAEKGLAIEGDPYALPVGMVPGAPPELQRALVKMLVLTALNARDRKSAFGSFRDGWPAGHMGKTMTNAELDRLLTAFVELHPHLADLVCADQGIRLMNVDGRIAERVHRHFTAQGVPVLSVHDSFIIDYTRVVELKQVMAEASLAVVGRELAVSQSKPGLDQFRASKPTPAPDIVQDFIDWCQIPRQQGYLDRLKGWEARNGKVIVPY